MILVRNNIEYRKNSSLSISRFKQHEHFILKEMTEGKTEFNRTSREIMLLKFRLWSRWISDTEDTIAFLPDSAIKEEDLENLLYTMHIVDHKYTTSIMDNVHLFEEKQSRCWLEVHRLIAYEYVLDRVKSIVGMDKSTAFGVIIDAIIEAMLMAMYELWEISTIIDDNRENKIAYTNMCIECMSDSNEVCSFTEAGMEGCTMLKRAKVYRDFYGADSFVAENYTCDDHTIPEKVIEYFKINNLILKDGEDDN